MNPESFVIFTCFNVVLAWDYGLHGVDWESCSGDRQSPIDIKRDNTILLDYDMLDLSMDYCQSISGLFKNDGKILKFETQNGNPSSTDFIIGGPLGTTKFYFLQLHLHWGSPLSYGAEHMVDGQRMAGEIHLVHVNEKYIDNGTIDPNAYQNQDGLAVLGIFLQDGSDDGSEWFDLIFEAVNEMVDSGMNTTDVSGLDLNQFVQRINPSFQAEFNYWTYDGSLTTPDCNQVVKWIIAERPLFITNEQFAEFSLLTLEDGMTSLADNYRKIQDENCRKISYVYKNTDTEYVFKPCLDGQYALGRNCTSCNCNTDNTEDSSTECNADGQCNCSPGYTGSTCEECTDDYYQIESKCIACNCNITNTVDANIQCIDGQCDCIAEYGSQTCDCKLGFYLLNGQCTECNCNINGVSYENWTILSQFDQLHLPCEDTTGNCIGQCHPGYTGSKCDTCAENYEIGYNLSTFFRTEFVTCRKSCPEGYDLPNQGFFMDFPYNITNFDYYDDFQANQSHDQHYNTYPHLCFFASSESLDYNSAKASCAAKSNGILFEPKSQNSLEAIIVEAEVSEEYWIGITFDGNWQYDSNAEMVLWFDGINGSEFSCANAHINSDEVLTINGDCNEAKKYICQTVSIVDQL